MKKKTKPKPKDNKAVGYIRVSTEEQANEGVSLIAQAARIEQYCDYKKLKLVAIFPDHKSAKDTKRPGYQAMKEFAFAGHASIIIAFKLDRLFRSVHSAVNETHELNERGIDFASVSEDINTKNGNGRVFFHILAAIAEWERDMVSERTKTAIETMKKQGRKFGQPVYGLRTFNRKGLQYFAQDHDEIRVLRKIQELRRQGLGWRRIARSLTDEKVPSPRGKGTWHPSAAKHVFDRAKRDGLL